MLLRVALALACSIAALKYAQRRRDHGPMYQQISVTDSVKTTRSSDDLNESAPKIQEEENKKQSFISVLILRFEELSAGKTVLPIDSESFENEDGAAKLRNFRDEVIDTIGHEIDYLKTVVSTMREKELKIGTQLRDVGPLKEQLKAHVDLRNQLTEKDSQIKILLSQITSLEVYTNKALQELSGKETLEQDLEMARIKIKELDRDRKNDASHRQIQLQILKQQLCKLQEIQELNLRKEAEHQKNLLVLKTLKAEINELKQGIKVLSQDREKLTIDLAAAEKRIAEVSTVTKFETQRDRENEASQLIHENIDLKKLVEEEQASRFREIEEVVYLKWVNACLQYELDMRKASCETPTASDYDETTSPASQQKLKQGIVRSTRPVLIPLNIKELEAANTSEIDFSPSPRLPRLQFSIENPAVKTSPRKQEPRKVFVRSSSSLSTDSEASNTSPKSRRTSLQLQEIHGNVVRSSSSLSSDSDISNASSKPRRNSASSPILESYLQRNAFEAETRGTSRFSPSASFGSRSELGRSSPVSTSKRILRQHSALSAESYANKTDASESVASSFQILSAANFSSGKHLAFKDLRKLTSVAEDERVGNPAETLNEGRVQDNDITSRNREAVVEKFSREDIENDSNGEGSTTKNTELGRFKLHESSKTPLTVAMPSPKPSLQDCVAMGHRHSKSTGASPFASPTVPSSPSDAPRAHADPWQHCDSSTLHLKDDCRVQRASQGMGVFRQSVMPKDAQEIISNSVSNGKAKAASAHSKTIKEIEDASMFFLAVKADVYTKGHFVQNLATKIRDAGYSDIEDVVAFVKWIDKELLALVDERAVVKHFDWPENIIDALREAAFRYQNMKTLEVEMNSYEPEPNTPCDVALIYMLALQEKTEDYVNSFLGSRDMAMVRYKKFSIPTDWMLDSGLLGKIKLASVQLAQKYMKRVLLELEHFRDIPAEKLSWDSILVQTARFAFKVHQFAEGFDLETLSTFNDLKDKSDGNRSEMQPTCSET